MSIQYLLDELKSEKVRVKIQSHNQEIVSKGLIGIIYTSGKAWHKKIMKKGKSLDGKVEIINPKSKGKRGQVRKDTYYTNLQTHKPGLTGREGVICLISSNFNMQHLKLTFH